MTFRNIYIKQPSAGSVSWNTSDELRGNLSQIAINPSSTTTTYDFLMTDEYGTVVYEVKGRKGHFRDDSNVGVYGVYTCTLSNTSTSSYSFITSLIWQEDV